MKLLQALFCLLIACFWLSIAWVYFVAFWTLLTGPSWSQIRESL